MKDNKTLFHVHTYRCGHAESISDEIYIKNAITLGYSDIWFTDHAPFPDDKFGNRMKYSDFNEYVVSLSKLKDLYKEQINVHIGLEIEYIKKYDENGYYQKLKEEKGIETLLLGQHFSEISGKNDTYTFDLDKISRSNIEEEYLYNSTVEGMSSGYFDAVAHPERIFKRAIQWKEEYDRWIIDIKKVSSNKNIPLEVNYASYLSDKNNFSKFWEKPVNRKIMGVDVHSLSELINSNQDKWY